MDYKLTFEDGSEGYLAHHGVKGMKWGVWNAETQARYAGKNAIAGGGGLMEDEQEYGGGGLMEDEDPENIKFAEEHPDVFAFADHEIGPDEARNGTNIIQNKEAYFRAGFSAMFDEVVRNVYNLSPQVGLKMVPRATEYETEAGRGIRSWAATNCATCSVVYDLRRRGYDVDANLNHSLQYTDMEGQLSSFYDGVELKKTKNFTKLDKELSDMPDGARGTLWGTTVNNTGHSIAWEKQNGKVVYHDAQTGRKYTSKTVNKLFKDKGSDSTGYARLDNCKPKLSAMYQQGLVSKKGRESKANIGKDITRTVAGEASRDAKFSSYKPESPVQRVVDAASPVSKYANNMDEYTNRVLRGKSATG